MEAIKKIFEIDLDVKRSTTSRTTNKVKQGDNGNVFIITLTHDGEPIDLTGTKVLVVFSKTDGTAQQDTDGHGVTIDPERNNVIIVELYATSFAPGIVECEIQVLSGENYGTLITSARFNFECDRAIINDETLLATNEYPILAGLIKTVDEAVEILGPIVETEAGRVAAEEDRIAAETARAEAETAREQAELLREQEEADRITDEQIRIGNEATRNEAENQRYLAESGRIAAEEARAEAETARATAETARSKTWGTATAATNTLTAGSAATAKVTLGANGVDFTFGIPQGEKGDKGDTGSDFVIKGYYASLSALQSAVPNPSAGDAYGIGSAAPYTIYVYDGVSKAWKDNGTIQGPTGKDGSDGADGKSAYISTHYATLYASDWGMESPESTVMTQYVSLSDLPENGDGEMYLSPAATQEQALAAAAAVMLLVQQNGDTFTIVAYGEAPSVDIPIVVRMVSVQ